MWSRFQRIFSNPSFLRNTSSLCMSAALFEWIQENRSAFSVPTWSDIQNAERSSNHFIGDGRTHSEIIEKWEAKLANEDEREILRFKPEITHSIAGRDGLHGAIVCELGVGTGLFAPEMAKAVRSEGCFIGLDVSPNFVYYMNQKYRKHPNVKVSLCTETDLCLPSKLKGEIDVFFLCATYHHLSDVNAIVQQMYDMLKPNGKLVIVDFKKPEHGHGAHGHKGHGHGHGKGHGHEHGHGHKEHGGKINHDKALYESFKNSKTKKKVIDVEWITGHIPFTESEARNEIEINGFVYERNVLPENWQHHFIHIYRKPSF